MYCVTESHRTVSSGLFLGSPEARSERSMPRVAPTLEWRQQCNALFSLIVVLNRNTLAPLDGKGALDPELRTVTATRSLISVRAREG